MPAPRARYIADLLQVHAEDLAHLWGQRRAALFSPRQTLREFTDLNERIEAHTQGLLVAPPEDLRALLQPGLAAPDRDDAFAAAYALLRAADHSSTRAVMIEFSRASGESLAGLRDALGFAPPAAFAAEVQSAFEQAKPLTAASAAVVLANHRQLDRDSLRLSRLIEDDDPLVCELAWRATAAADGTGRRNAEERPYDRGTQHAAPGVRDAAWGAMTWAGSTDTLPRLREVAASGDAVAIRWLAVLGQLEDVPRLKEAVLATDDPRARCALLARFGHPMALNALLRWMEDDDIALASFAGEAFTRLTGHDIRGERRRMPVPDDADDFEREMAPDVWLPDVTKARALLDRHGGAWAQGQRWCNGLRVDGELPRDALAGLDFEARWDVAARAAVAGRHLSKPAPIL